MGCYLSLKVPVLDEIFDRLVFLEAAIGKSELLQTDLGIDIFDRFGAFFLATLGQTHSL